MPIRRITVPEIKQLMKSTRYPLAVRQRNLESLINTPGIRNPLTRIFWERKPNKGTEIPIKSEILAPETDFFTRHMLPHLEVSFKALRGKSMMFPKEGYDKFLYGLETLSSCLFTDSPAEGAICSNCFEIETGRVESNEAVDEICKDWKPGEEPTKNAILGFRAILLSALAYLMEEYIDGWHTWELGDIHNEILELKAEFAIYLKLTDLFLPVNAMAYKTLFLRKLEEPEVPLFKEVLDQKAKLSEALSHPILSRSARLLPEAEDLTVQMEKSIRAWENLGL